MGSIQDCFYYKKYNKFILKYIQSKNKKIFFIHLINKIKDIIFVEQNRGMVAEVARQAHNLKVGGSIPSPATNILNLKNHVKTSQKNECG